MEIEKQRICRIVAPDHQLLRYTVNIEGTTAFNAGWRWNRIGVPYAKREDRACRKHQADHRNGDCRCETEVANWPQSSHSSDLHGRCDIWGWSVRKSPSEGEPGFMGIIGCLSPSGIFHCRVQRGGSGAENGSGSGGLFDAHARGGDAGGGPIAVSSHDIARCMQANGVAGVAAGRPVDDDFDAGIFG